MPYFEIIAISNCPLGEINQIIEALEGLLKQENDCMLR